MVIVVPAAVVLHSFVPKLVTVRVYVEANGGVVGRGTAERPVPLNLCILNIGALVISVMPRLHPHHRLHRKKEPLHLQLCPDLHLLLEHIPKKTH